jgi:hypothetical protein
MLAAGALAAGCGGGGAEPPAGLSVPAGCTSAGRPVTLAQLVSVFRANGISLDVNVRKCGRPGSSRPDATNSGPTGLESREDVDRREGYVLCDVGPREATRELEVERDPSGEVIELRFLNVACEVYPSNEARALEQVGRVVDAMRALADEAPSLIADRVPRGHG